MTLFRWSKTAASNDTADLAAPGNINWAEGQSPATVNDSARGMMAAIAKYRDDVSGRVATTGTSTAYALTSFQQFTSLALMDGAMVAFVPNVTCGATVTLNVDTLGAKPLRPAPSVELIAGQLIAGTPYAATYNNSSGVWYLQNILGTFVGALPIGAIMPYAGGSAPTSLFALCFGQSLAGTSFPALRDILAAASPTFPYGGNATNFNIPDLRGRVAAGQDNMGGSAASRITTVLTDTGTIVGTTLGSGAGSQSHVLAVVEMPTHNHTGSTATDSGHTHPVPLSTTTNIGATASTAASPGSGVTTGTGTANITLTIANQGSSQAVSWLQPTIILNYIIRVL